MDLCFSGYLQFDSRGISLPKIPYTFGKNPFVFKKNQSKICINPFALKKSPTLFPLSEVPLDLIRQIRGTSRFVLALAALQPIRFSFHFVIRHRHPRRTHWKEAVAMTSLVNRSREGKTARWERQKERQFHLKKENPLEKWQIGMKLLI